MLNEIEEELCIIENNLNACNTDTYLWKRDSEYRKEFSTQKTWDQLREKSHFVIGLKAFGFRKRLRNMLSWRGCQ